MDYEPPPETMTAVVTTGTGGYERLEVREVPVPRPGPGQVLLRVLAAAVNNTDINTRVGWYSTSVSEGTEATDERASGRNDGGWSGATPFPLIQGTDGCGRIVAAGEGADERRVGARVLVRPCMRTDGFASMDSVWLGSDFDGAFAQYVVVPEGEAFEVDSGWSDAELASLPCAYGTAENMLERAGVGAGMRVLIPGASGGVGSAAVQLARRRGAEVVGVTSAAKVEAVRSLGTDRVLSRDDDLLVELGSESVDVVIDNVVGDAFGPHLELLRRGGRYVSSGAIAGPKVELDLRTLYLKDLTLFGTTAWDEAVFPNLVRYVEAGEIRPLVDEVYPLERIVDAQRRFAAKDHLGKIVLLPPG